MSLLAATQIPKPADEQAFERASIVLWRGLLNDPNVQRNGRRGQRQNGVDLFGIRDADIDRQVGIQCKLKSEGHVLTEEEVRGEVKKALTFKPRLREYFIITTAPDDVAMQELARVVTAELRDAGAPIFVYVWGWNTLEERIIEDAAARKAFDPTFDPFSEQILVEAQRIGAVQSDTRVEIGAGFSRLEASISLVRKQLQTLPGDATKTVTLLEAHLDSEIDRYRDLADGGKPRTAKALFESLLERVKPTASGRILFRVKANIGSCLLALGEDERAASILSDAYDHAPEEPKAIANKAFSLLLQGKWQELLSFGAGALRADPTNEGLAGYLVQAARFDMSVSDPLLLVPETLRDASAVAISRTDFVRRRGAPGDWWAVAHQALAAHPDDAHAIQFDAEAKIDEVVSSPDFMRTRRLTPERRGALESAVAALTTLWDKARCSEAMVGVESAALCGNIIVALHALDEPLRAVAMARQGLALAPNDVSIITRAALVAIDTFDDALAEELLPKLAEGPEATILAFRLHSSRRNWAELARLYPEKAEQLPQSEKLIISTAARLAAIKIGSSPGKQDLIQQVATDAAIDPRASIVVADFARMEGLNNISKTAFETALKNLGTNPHIADRMMVSFHAAQRSDWSVVVDLLDTHIAEDHDSNELRTLARAHVNDSPIRQRALRFFARLPGPVRDLPYYLHAEGLFKFNHGDLQSAATLLRKAVEVEANLDNYLALFSVLRRDHREEEVKPILDSIDLGSVDGTPVQKMHLAQLLRASGKGQEALHYAYDVLQSAKNDRKAALGYFGLIIMEPDDGLMPVANVIGIDTFVSVEGEHGRRDSFVIIEGADRPAESIISPMHPTAAAAMGMKVGDTFEVSVAFGETRTWRITEIKHKFLHALHDVMENFETRFPDAEGFYSVTAPEGDIQPVLDQIRKASEGHRRLADIYLSKNVPLNMIAERQGGDTIGFAEYVRSLGEDIRTCIGMEAERLGARSVIASNRASGAVLDTYAAWTISTMGAFDVVRSVFGNLTVPVSVISELMHLAQKHEHTGQPSMTVGWRNGAFFRQEHTEEDITARRNFILEQIQNIEEACHVKPATAPDNPTEIASVATETFGAHVIDAANLAAEGYVLISEDMYFRQWAEAATSAKGVWLQTVFAYARETGMIDRKHYSALLVKLAWRRHSHLAVDAQDLFDAYEADATENLLNFKSLAHFIGNKNAEMKSHLIVAIAFLERIWVDRSVETTLKKMKATGSLLDTLIRHTGVNWALALALITTSSGRTLQHYINGWVEGHFLSLEDLAKAELEISGVPATINVAGIRQARFKSSSRPSKFSRVGKGKRGK